MDSIKISFLVIALATIGGLFFATRKNPRIVWLYSLWFILLGVAALLNFFQDTQAIPPRFIFILLPSILLTVFAYRYLKNKPTHVAWLIAIHLIRIPVELVLFQLYLHELIPKSMTFHGWNWDILSGISAIVVLILYLKNLLSPKVLKVWNITAMTFLAIIVITAMLSAPSPLQLLSHDQPNKAILYFPFVFLPGIVVPIVLLSHLLLLKKGLPK